MLESIFLSMPVSESEVRGWATAFLFTQAVEVPIYLTGLDRFARYGFWARLGIATLLSTVSHPVVWFGFPRLISAYLPMVLAAECFAVGSEAAMLMAFKVRPRYAFTLALFANLMSVGLGLLSRAAFGVP